MFNGTIYVITNLNNNKKYVGLTRKTAEQRFEEHINNALEGADTILYNAIRKHGKENFKVEVLETGIDNADDLKQREKYWIKELDTHVFTGGHGYNMTVGGDGKVGTKLSKKTREKISEAQSGENNGMWGRKHTDESRNKMKNFQAKRFQDPKERMKMSKANVKRFKDPKLRKRISEASSKAVIIILPDSTEKEFLVTFKASRWLSDYLQIPYTTVDRYIVDLLKGREPRIPKKYKEILPQYSVRYKDEQETA